MALYFGTQLWSGKRSESINGWPSVEVRVRHLRVAQRRHLKIATVGILSGHRKVALNQTAALVGFNEPDLLEGIAKRESISVSQGTALQRTLEKLSRCAELTDWLNDIGDSPHGTLPPGGASFVNAYQALQNNQLDRPQTKSYQCGRNASKAL